MASVLLPEIVILVSGTHWQCVTCKLHSKRSVSLDEHLKLKHPYCPHPPPRKLPVTLQSTLRGGEEYEDVTENKSARGRRAASTKQGPLSEVSQWLKHPEFGDSSDEVEDVDFDDDSDFVPSELKSKWTVRKQEKKGIIKRVQLPKKEKPLSEKGPEADVNIEQDHSPVLDSTQQIKSEYTDLEQDQEFHLKPTCPGLKRSTGDVANVHMKPKGKQARKRTSQPSEAVAESRVPKKRGRPPKPKPVALDGEELEPKRPYRKKTLDPSELLLKLRNVGRKPNTRKKVLPDEIGGLKNSYIKLVSKGNPLVVVSEQGEKVQMKNDESLSMEGHPSDQNDSRLSVDQDSRSSLDTASSSAIPTQTGKLSRERVRCKICMCLFLSDQYLQEHLNSVSVEDVVQCIACKMKFHGLIDLNMHVFCDHEYEKQPFCFLCKDDFRSMEKLEKHLYLQHKGEPDRKLADTRFHDCRLCCMELNIDFQLIKNHYYRRHKAYVCPECYGKDVELLFYTDTNLYTGHKQMHARSPSECMICHMVFPTAREMKTHMWAHASDSVEDGTGGKCSKCEKWLPNSGAMLMHEKEHKNEAIRKNYALEASIGFPCMKCEHIFSSKSNLKKHSCKADPNRTFYFHCEYCAHGCNTKEQLRDHIALHHLGIKRYTCDYCEQCFVCAPTLRRHVRRAHTKEKPYECHLCKERFYERNLMLRHVSKHTGIASFMCEFCGKGFHTKFDLKKHVENHTDSRDFVCPNCGLDYKRSYHLKRHLEKGCRKRFPQNSEEGSMKFVAGDIPLVAREDADEMVYIDLAEDEDADGTDDIDHDGEDMDNYNDESSGPDYVDDDNDDEII